MSLALRLSPLVALGLIVTPAAAQEAEDSGKPDVNILIGIGPKIKPAFPGADKNKIIPLPVVDVWRENERRPVSTPDESFGIALIGKRGKTAFGPTLGFATQRKGKDAVAGLSDVKFGVEAGGFAETYLAPALRLRGEMRQAIGAHKGMTGELGADLVMRGTGDKWMATLGPRLRWGNARYNRAYYGVTPGEAAVTGLAPYRPGSGIYAYGAMAGLYHDFGPHWGVYGFAGYDRLTGKAAKSPIVTDIGSRDQFSAGVAVTYRFKMRR